jgi:hypothetical protein
MDQYRQPDLLAYTGSPIAPRARTQSFCDRGFFSPPKPGSGTSDSQPKAKATGEGEDEGQLWVDKRKSKWWHRIGEDLYTLSYRTSLLANAEGYKSSKADELTLLAEARKVNEDGMKTYCEILVGLEKSKDPADVGVRRDFEQRLQKTLEHDQFCRAKILRLEWWVMCCDVWL